MEVPFVLLVGLFFAAAVYLILSKFLVRVLLGVVLLGNGVNLLIFTSGRILREVPPVIPAGHDVPAALTANPLPQALILTAIVIGFALTVMLAVLVLRAWRHSHSIDARNVDSAEALGTPQERELTDD